MLIRRPLLLVAPAAIVALAVALLARFQAIGPNGLYFQDFVEYWAAGHLNASGQNPYDPELMGKVEQQVRPYLGREVMMWNPPWTLTLVMPLGRLPCHWAHLIWLFMSLTIILVGADMLWRFYGGILRYRSVAWVIALSFTPTLLVLEMGQITPLILLGLLGFLYFEGQGRDSLAGACLLLVAIKPHLVYLIGLAILAWVIDRRRWSVLLGAGIALLVGTAVPLATNREVLNQYWQALSEHPPAHFYSPTLGRLLRIWLGPDKFWLQFVPVILGVAWLAWYWFRHRRDWHWPEQLPVLLLTGYLTAPYGAWPFDYVVMLIPLVVMAVHVVANPQPGTVAYAGISFLGFDLLSSWIRTFSYEYHHISIWMTPMLILMYLTLVKTPIADGVAAKKDGMDKMRRRRIESAI